MEITDEESALLSGLAEALRGRKLSILPEPDWEKVRQLAARQKVLPLVYDAVGLQMRGCRTDSLQQLVLQIEKSQAFRALWEALEGKGLEPLVVKGILCRRLYPKPDLRPSSDEDLLVSDRDWLPAMAVLRELGYVPTGDDDPAQWEIGWVRGPSYVELHRRLFPADSGAYGSLNGLLEGAETCTYPVEGGPVRSFCPRDHLLYLLLHAYKHFLHSGFGIRQVCDIGLWAANYADQIDFDGLLARLDQVRAGTFARAVFRLAERWLQIELPEPLRNFPVDPDPMLRDLLDGGIYGGASLSRRHSATVTLSAVEADRTNRRTGPWQTLFPPREKLLGRYPQLRDHPARLPLCWLDRLWHYARETGAAGDSDAGESLRIARSRRELLRLYEIIS